MVAAQCTTKVPPAKQRQVEQSGEDPYLALGASAAKENVELRRRLTALRTQIRALQQDITTVHSGTQGHMEEATVAFAERFEVVATKAAEVRAENDTLEIQVLESTQAADVAAVRVEAAATDRVQAEADHQALLAIIDARRASIADVDSELLELKQAESDLHEEIKHLEEAKRSGVTNLEAVKAKNAIESQELAVEEAKLRDSSAKLDALREKIASLKKRRGQ
jgi:chromosome segregation ATPase